ncbi:MAG TPA: hypothetical protein VNA20_11615 [Frankiaceae bacterium]|nr:hypothetical protein [Frankiaceae bacterium]
MRRRLVAVPLAAFALVLPDAHAASVKLVVSDPKGDANFSGLHGQSIPVGSQEALDITAVTFDTTRTVSYKIVKRKRVKVETPTGIVVTITTAAPPSTTPTSSYGLSGTHSACGLLRMQIYYSPDGPTTYGDLADCGSDGNATNPDQFSIDFSPKIQGNNLVLAIPFKSLPKQFKVGTFLDKITAYTSTAEFVAAGYQPADVNPDAGIDTVTAEKAWKVS